MALKHNDERGVILKINQFMFTQNQDIFSQEGGSHTHSDLTLIHKAAQNNDLAMLREGLQKNVDINAVTNDGWTALHFAAYKGYIEIVKALLAAGIDASIQGNLYGRTALHYAANQGYLEVVKAIISHDSSLKFFKDRGGKTPLDIANEKGFADIAEVIAGYHKN